MGIATHPDPIVIIVDDNPGYPGVPSTCAHHRNWPELSGEGTTPREAAEDLLRLLIAELDGDLDGWHRNNLELVIAEVRASLDRLS